MLKDDRLINKISKWRLPTKSEADDFIEYLEINYPKCEIGGACWTSTPYKDSEITCWVANFDLNSSFARFHGTRNQNHGYFQGCIRLVCPIEDTGEKSKNRLTETAEYWIDHQQNLAWQKNLISDKGIPTKEAHHVWVGSLIEATKVVQIANENIKDV
tara:strand:- start:29732 stop:30205 length:474 start_codon:yes stop_codon:yes gene_type:complete